MDNRRFIGNIEANIAIKNIKRRVSFKIINRDMVKSSYFYKKVIKEYKNVIFVWEKGYGDDIFYKSDMVLNSEFMNIEGFSNPEYKQGEIVAPSKLKCAENCIDSYSTFAY